MTVLTPAKVALIAKMQSARSRSRVRCPELATQYLLLETELGCSMVDPEPFLGLDLASFSPLSLAFLAVHAAAALVAIITGMIAMLSREGSGRHAGAGRGSLPALLVVFARSWVLASIRLPTDLPLVAAGAIAVFAATFGVAFLRLQWPGDIPRILAMGVFSKVLPTAFDIDNGPHLPIWDLLPARAPWILPTVVGGPLLAPAVSKRKRPSPGHPSP